MKKVMALVLAVVLAFGMASVAFAAAPKITGIKSSFDYNIGSSNGTASGGAYNFDADPEDDLKLYLSSNDFDWDTDPGKLASSHLNAYKITVKKRITKGSNVLDEISMEKDGDNMYIKVAFVDQFVSTSEQDFDFTIYLSKSGSKLSGTEVQIYGTMENEEILVDEYDEEVDLSGHAYAKADEYIKAIKVDTGNGLFINAKMFDGKKYYAKSSMDVSASDDAVLNKYPEIEVIYTLSTINFSGAANNVEFDIEDKYHVFDADGMYLGTTSDKLAFSSKYYMATSRIDMNSGSDDVVNEEPADNDVGDPVGTSPNMGGDDVPASPSDNPGTGVNGIVSAIAALGLVALAIGAVSMKKK